MLLPDVSVLVAAFRDNHPAHAECREWLVSSLRSADTLAVSELVLSAVLRIVTHPTAAIGGVDLDSAVRFVESVRGARGVQVLRTGPRHWEIFLEVARTTPASGSLLSDAYHAAVAIEHNCEWVTLDRDFARFPGLRWSMPR